MRFRVLILCLLLPACCFRSIGQTNRSGDAWIRYVEELAEELDAEDAENGERIGELYADLSEWLEHPLDLNTADAETFKRLPFLSETQIEALIAYRERYGKMATVYELKHIEALDRQTIERLLPFVYAGEAVRTPRSFTPANLLKYGRHELATRYDRCLQQKQGYRAQPERKYLGEPFYTSLRYAYSFDERLRIGGVAEKDAGEPFANRYHKGFDFYSVHLLVRDLGRLKTLIVGDYKASFGQGLVMSHDFMPGRSAMLLRPERQNNGFRQHYSTNETDFFRGVATAFRWKNVDAHLFYSSRKRDATVEGDRIGSFKDDGLHRVASDWEKRRTAEVQTYGGNVRYATPKVVVGVTALTCRYGPLSVQPDDQPYNRFYFRGSQNANASVDYLLEGDRLKLFGETAVSANGAWATLNTLQWSPASYLSGLILYRSYARDFQADYANAFSQNSRVQNEEGLYAGLRFTPAARWQWTGYADFFRFPWLKYGVDAPSSGVEYMGQADYSDGNRFSFYLRYRVRQREANRTVENEPESRILPYWKHRMRCQLTYEPSPEWVFRPAVDGAVHVEKGQSRGWMVSQNVAWKPERTPLQADLYLACFRTDDYDSRINSYEKRLLYMYNTSFFYGRGTRVAVTARYFLTERASLSTKIGWSHYFDAETTGSALETIDGPNRTDLYLMLQWKF